jgi:uncharacterized protein YndB with AHSA1/START domain
LVRDPRATRSAQAVARRGTGAGSHCDEKGVAVVTIDKDITIKAPPETVFGFLEDPKHFPEIFPSLIEVKDVEKLPTGGYRYHWIYKLAGFKFEGETMTTQWAPPKTIVDKTKGEIESTFEWKFFPENGHTKVELEIGFEFPKQLVGKFEEPFLLRLNEREAEMVLWNLKDRLEL